MDTEYDIGTIVRKPCARITLKILLERRFGSAANDWDEEKKVSELNKTTRMRLDRENIASIDGLELLGTNLTHLYLQHNMIEMIENLEFLPNIKFMTLANNRIRKLEGVKHLKHLAFLDVSENLLVQVDTDELPRGLIILNLEGNKCTVSEDYRLNMIRALPKLKTLDNIDLVRQEKVDAGYDLSSDSEDDSEDNEEEEAGDGQDYANENERHRHIGEMLVSSQRRLENDYILHKKKLLELDEIRENSTVPLTTRASSRSSYGD